MKFLFYIFLLFFAKFSYANSAQPGLWNAGGTGTFSLLYPEDSSSFKKIQMVKELVTIKLYDGFAVVKGSYWMYNTSSDALRIKTGYPINGVFESEKGHYKSDVYFDDLYKLKVFINGKSSGLLVDTITNVERSYLQDNWYIWLNNFPPLDTTLIEVYFIVKTNGANIRKGYSSENINGFVYLLESGSTWKQPITKGRIQIQLADEIELSDIRGISPDTLFNWNSKLKLFLTDFQNLSPTPFNNIVISYESLNNELDFTKVINQSEIYFKEIDQIEKIKTDLLIFEQKRMGSPFNVLYFGIEPEIVIILFVLVLMTFLIVSLLYIFKFIFRKIKSWISSRS